MRWRSPGRRGRPDQLVIGCRSRLQRAGCDMKYSGGIALHPERSPAMKLSVFALSLAAALLAGSPAFAAASNSTSHASEASIPFANHGGVDDWRAVGDSTIY